MTHTVKKTFAMLLLAIFGSVLLYNCEPEPDSLGEQLFTNETTEGTVTPYDLIAYNINNHDTIRSDASKLINLWGSTSSTAVLGAFNESKFGMQKASYLTQLRLSTDNPDFGTNAVVDSVVLVIRPSAAQYDGTALGDITGKASFLNGDNTIPTNESIKTYSVNKYGNIGTTAAPTLFNINVNEVTTFLDANNPNFTRSNVSVSTGALLGSRVFNGNVTAMTILKTSDNSTAFTSNLGFRIPLDKTFFQNKIIAKKGQPELQDASNFTRYFNGIRISVAENDGYLFQFSPNDMEMIMYYKSDVTTNGVVTRPQTTFTFNLKEANAHIGQYEYNRAGSSLSTALTTSSEQNGDPRLYTQAMGGPSIGVKIQDADISKLKTLYQNNKAAIVGAKIRIYTDATNWNNAYAKPTKFTLLPVDSKAATGELISSTFTQDMLLGFTPYKMYDLDKNPAYYDFTVTKTVKDIVETGAENKTLVINLGEFLALSSSTTTLAGYKYTSRSFAMDRAVFVGTDASSANRIQLLVTYGTKK
jgi:hypothetical protein